MDAEHLREFLLKLPYVEETMQWGENLVQNYDAYIDFLIKNNVLKQKVPAADLVTNDLIGDINKFDAKAIEAQAKGWKG